MTRTHWQWMIRCWSVCLPSNENCQFNLTLLYFLCFCNLIIKITQFAWLLSSHRHCPHNHIIWHQHRLTLASKWVLMSKWKKMKSLQLRFDIWTAITKQTHISIQLNRELIFEIDIYTLLYIYMYDIIIPLLASDIHR